VGGEARGRSLDAGLDAAVTPQSLALHEAIADLVSFRSERLCEAVLSGIEDGSIRDLIAARCDLRTTSGLTDGEALLFELPAQRG